MNVEIGAEAALFPEKEYINGIAVAVYHSEMPLTASSDGLRRREFRKDWLSSFLPEAQKTHLFFYVFSYHREMFHILFLSQQNVSHPSPMIVKCLTFFSFYSEMSHIILL
jgi:hypothetical protein